MKIELITEAEHDVIRKIFYENPQLTFQNNGYNYIDESKLSEKDKVALATITEILEKHIVGFSEFNNFCHSLEGKLRLRFQYNYGAEDNTMPFTGVGYLLLDELINGFNTDLHLKK